MTIRSCVGALAVAISLMAPAVSAAQTPTDPELLRVVTAFRDNSGTVTLNAISPGMLARFSRRDRAIAEMYRGFALLRLRRQAEGEAALQRAAGLDPSVLPEPQLAGQDLVDSYRVARARMPVIASFSLAPLEFIPQLDSATRLTYQLEGGRILRRTRAEMRLLLVPEGSNDSIVLWSGVEGDTNAVWNGRVNGQLVESGNYEYVLEARGPDVPVTSQARRRVRIDRATMDSSRLLVLPVPPRVLPESSVFAVVDRDRKSRLARRGIKIGVVGGVMAGVAAALVQTAIDRTPPRSGMRKAVAGSYIAGLSTVAVGGALLLYSRSSRFQSEVAFPNNENIRLNRELKRAYDAESNRVNRYNETLRNAVILRQTFLDAAPR